MFKVSRATDLTKLGSKPLGGVREAAQWVSLFPLYVHEDLI